MNPRILTSGMTILAVVAAVSGMTYAFFSDSGTSTNNVFAAGNMDLKLTDASESDADSVTLSFGGSALAPGGCTSLQTLKVKNTGTVPANHIELAVANTVTDVSPPATPDIDSFLKLDTFTYDGNPISVPNSNVNGIFDLNDLATNGVDDLPLTNLNSDHTIALKLCLDPSADNTIQNDSVLSDWTVTLQQDASQ